MSCSLVSPGGGALVGAGRAASAIRNRPLVPAAVASLSDASPRPPRPRRGRGSGLRGGRRSDHARRGRTHHRRRAPGRRRRAGRVRAGAVPAGGPGRRRRSVRRRPPSGTAARPSAPAPRPRRPRPRTSGPPSSGRRVRRSTSSRARSRPSQGRIQRRSRRPRRRRPRPRRRPKKARDAAIANQGYTPGTTDVREIARQILMNKFSYGDDQFACFSWIITRESNWNVHAQNASSGAYGLPQSLPGSKMASVARRLARQPGDPDHLGRPVHEEPLRQPVRRQVALGVRRELLSRSAADR